MKISIAIAAFLVGMPIPSFAQTAAAAQGAASVVAADPKDVGSLDAIVRALYECVSGAKGVPRDFDRMRSLFATNARLWQGNPGPDGKPRQRSWTVDEYMAAAGPQLLASGFFENEIGRSTQSFGNVSHVMSAYASRLTPDAAPFSRGVNSIQLLNGHDRWYIVSVFWDAERPNNPIPPELLAPKPPPN